MGMHVERLTDGSERLSQALVRFPLARVAASPAWWPTFETRALAAGGIDALTRTYRFSVSADGEADITLAATVREGDEPALRRCIGGFAWLEGECRDSVRYPDSEAAFRQMAAAFPARRQRLVAPLARTQNGAWLAQGDRLIPHVAAIAKEALSLGHAFGYQLLAAPLHRSAEQLRRIGRNVIALEDSRGMRAELLAEQRRLFERTRQATLMVEEVVGTDDTDAAGQWLAGALTRIFAPPAVRRGLPPPEFRPQAAEDEDFALLLHGSVLDEEAWTTDDLICSQAADETEWAALFRQQPPAGRTPPHAAATPPEPAPAPAGGGPHVPNAPPHFFLSYRRDEFAAVRPILDTLHQHGVPVWYDAGIDVGSHWIEMLERKIDEATGVLAILSPGFIESRYCRREVLFADTLGKPILPIVLAPVELGHGLNFTLHSTQMLSVSARDFWAELLRRLAELQRSAASG